MFTVALTGNVAAGKSTVGQWFADWGATLLDADRIVHELQEPGTPTHRAIVAAFGPGVLHPDGTLDRKALRGHVLADPDERAALEKIVHPAVRREHAQRMELARRNGDAILVSDIPLLYETGQGDRFDLVVLVDAPIALRRARLTEGRGLTDREADQLLATQWPASEKRPRADIVIDNDEDLLALRTAAENAWMTILERARSSA